eukprot:jgi/Bigna1/86241/estExt_fgenesh1_pg.C_90092
MSNLKAFAETALKRIPNGVRAQRAGGIFSEAEIQTRVGKLREYMQQNQIDACVLTSYHNVNYYTGFLYCAFGRPYAAVVTPDNVTTLSANIDFGQPYRRGMSDNLVYTDWRRNNFFRGVRELVGVCDGKKVRLGFEEDHLSIERLNTLLDFIPEAEGNLCEVGAATMKMRMTKSDEEIELIKNGARIADIGGAAVVEALQSEAGIPEHEVAMHATQAMIREIARTYPESELMDTWTWFQSGPENTDGAHNPVTSRAVQDGDILSLNCFPMISGYYTALERTLFMGHASDEHLRVWNANVEVHERGLELIQPGAKCSDIAKELNEVFLKHGLLEYRTFGYGHSFGTLCHYYGREAGLELREDIDTILAENMVVSMEPMVTLPIGHPAAGGYREHDILVVKKDGAENITKFPFGPEKNIVKLNQ